MLCSLTPPNLGDGIPSIDSAPRFEKVGVLKSCLVSVPVFGLIDQSWTELLSSFLGFEEQSREMTSSMLKRGDSGGDGRGVSSSPWSPESFDWTAFRDGPCNGFLEVVLQSSDSIQNLRLSFVLPSISGDSISFWFCEFFLVFLTRTKGSLSLNGVSLLLIRASFLELTNWAQQHLMFFILFLCRLVYWRYLVWSCLLFSFSPLLSMLIAQLTKKLKELNLTGRFNFTKARKNAAKTKTIFGRKTKGNSEFLWIGEWLGLKWTCLMGFGGFWH